MSGFHCIRSAKLAKLLGVFEINIPAAPRTKVAHYSCRQEVDRMEVSKRVVDAAEERCMYLASI
jgi:hypothetical protein